MAETSARLLRLLSLLERRVDWSAAELAERLGVSARTVRRDIQALRALDYPIHAALGPRGGYRLGAGTKLPPLVLDEDQAMTVAVALQTAPHSVTGVSESAGQALSTLRQVMPPRLRAEVDALDLTAVRNYWEFGGPPVDAATLRAVGRAVRGRQVLRFDYARADGSLAEPPDADFVPPLRVEPHHLALWAGRWYLVAFVASNDADSDTDTDGWAIYRVDRIHPKDPTGLTFTARPFPADSVADYVRTNHRRGDTPAPWPCQGSAVMALPATVVSRWAPGGSLVESVDDDSTRLTLGAWSWAGVAGVLATFDTPLGDVRPRELREACRRLGGVLTNAVG